MSLFGKDKKKTSGKLGEGEHDPDSSSESKEDRVKHKLCPNCGCDLTGQHWFRCPRCQQELDAGCSGCGACNS